MKVPVDEVQIKNIEYVSELYKTGEKQAYTFTSWAEISKRLSNKRGRKPIGFMIYTKQGIYKLYMEYNLSDLLNLHLTIK